MSDSPPKRSYSVNRRTIKKPRQNTRKNHTRRYSINIPKPNNISRIGEGGSGIVSRPPSSCNIASESPANRARFRKEYYKNPNYVSKLTEYSSAKKEMEIGAIIRRNIADFSQHFCLVEYICDAPRDKIIRASMNDYLDTYAIMPYGGITLQSIIDGTVYFSPLELCCVVDSLRGLFDVIRRLHTIGIFHNDIHTENILYDTKSRRLRIIDFGMATDFGELKEKYGDSWTERKVVQNAMLHDYEQITFKVLGIILLKMEEIDKTDKMEEERKAKTSIKSGKPLHRITDCYDKYMHYLDKLDALVKRTADKSDEELLDNCKKYINTFINDGRGYIDDDTGMPIIRNSKNNAKWNCVWSGK
jgi:serine/threonine protein kinase